jgi:hypothetical protein
MAKVPRAGPERGAQFGYGETPRMDGISFAE